MDCMVRSFLLGRIFLQRAIWGLTKPPMWGIIKITSDERTPLHDGAPAAWIKKLNRQLSGQGGLIFFAHDFDRQCDNTDNHQKKEARKVGLGWRSQIAVRDRDKARLGAENAVFSTAPWLDFSSLGGTAVIV